MNSDLIRILLYFFVTIPALIYAQSASDRKLMISIYSPDGSDCPAMNCRMLKVSPVVYSHTGTDSLTEHQLELDTFTRDKVRYTVKAIAKGGKATVRVYNSPTSYETVLKFDDYRLSDSGMTVWLVRSRNMLTFYTAGSSILEHGIYRHATPDSFRVDLNTLFTESLLSEKQLHFLYKYWLESYLKVSVSPNPATDAFVIGLNSNFPPLKNPSDALKLELYSVNGKLISTQAVQVNRKYHFNVPAHLSGGMILYLIKWEKAFISGSVQVYR